MPLQPNISRKHWENLASRWNRMGPPLRPSPEDVQTVRKLLGGAEGSRLLLGVTPELSGLTGQLVALDSCAGMVAALWRGNRAGHHAVLGNWLDMPFADDSFDGVVGDGSFTLLEYPLQYRQLFSHLERVMKPGGLLIVRIFAAPETGETCAMACSDAMHGKIQGFHAFKWRLSMAMTSEACNPNLRVADTHEMFNHLLPDRERLARASGWSMEDISTIDFYQGSSARYSYPTLTQFRHIIPPGFRETGLIRGTYELAERCPILALELAQ